MSTPIFETLMSKIRRMSGEFQFLHLSERENGPLRVCGSSPKQI
jgi:hypothetical protein